METKLTITEKKIAPVVAEAERIAVIDEASKAEATEFLSKANTLLDSVIEYKEKKTVPLNEALKVIRAETKPIEDALKTAVATIRGKLGAYQTEKMRIAREEEAKIAERIKPGKGNLSLEKGVEKMDQVVKPSASVETDSGSLKFRTDKKLKITNHEALLNYICENKATRFIQIDEKLLFLELKNGVKIPGAEIEEVQTPINSR